MRDRPDPSREDREDVEWRRRKRALAEGVYRRVAAGRPSAAERKRQEELYRAWIEAGRPGDFLAFAHSRRDPDAPL